MAAFLQAASPALLCPTARSLETEDEPGFWRFWEMTADRGLYMLARHGEHITLGRRLDRAPVMGSDALLTVPRAVPSHREVC